jgi:2-desacetyl-2-hydroxyethyl bacteriochlorophyllide A dehydrogenase
MDFMEKKMLAVVKNKYEPGIEIQEIPIPKFRHDEVLINVKAAGICGTDIHIYEWKKDNEYKWIKLPLVLGHEIAGIVEKTGENSRWEIGQRVIVNPVINCGECEYCLAGLPNLCINRKLIGVNLDGGFAQYVAVPQRNIIKLPEELSFEEGACIEPLGVAVRALENSFFKPGDRVVIFGPGPIGLMAMQIFLNCGAKETIMIGTKKDKLRLQKALDLGAQILNIDDANINDEFISLKEKGVNIVIDFSGSVHVLQKAIEIVKPAGQIILGSIYNGFSKVDLTSLVRNEIKVATVRSRIHNTWKRAIDLVKTNKIDLNKIITNKFNLCEAEKAFTKSVDMLEGKIILLP